MHSVRSGPICCSIANAGSYKFAIAQQTNAWGKGTAMRVNITTAAAVGLLAALLVATFGDGLAATEGPPFAPDEFKGVLLEDADVAPFVVERQSRHCWPGPHLPHERPGVQQYISAEENPKVRVVVYRFDGERAAADGADLYAHSMAEIFEEGRLGAETVGEGCWITMPSYGPALVFHRGTFCGLVGVRSSTVDARGLLLEIAQKLDRKIQGLPVQPGLASALSAAPAEGRGYSYSLTRTPSPQLLVGGVDVGTLAVNHLPESWRVTERSTPWGRRFIARYGATLSQIELQVGVYDSVATAEQQTLGLLTTSLGRFERAGGSLSDLGDSGNCWCYCRNSAATIVFLRSNVLVSVAVGSPDPEQDAERIARAVDAEITAGTAVLELTEEVSLPLVSDVVSPASVAVGEKAQIEVEAVDPAGGEVTSFAFVTFPRPRALTRQRSNVFLFEGVDLGVNEVIVGAINDENVVALWRQEITVHE